MITNKLLTGFTKYVYDVAKYLYDNGMNGNLSMAYTFETVREYEDVLRVAYNWDDPIAVAAKEVYELEMA